jgi:hypothetical protein
VIDMEKKIIYRDGEPCTHKGCRSHISKPCEGCGRKGAKGEVVIRTLEFADFCGPIKGLAWRENDGYSVSK